MPISAELTTLKPAPQAPLYGAIVPKGVASAAGTTRVGVAVAGSAAGTAVRAETAVPVGIAALAPDARVSVAPTSVTAVATTALAARRA
ncbi:hypothetical protein [Streptomyces sp. NPDC088725]|uniref:hypothetical protein n=1 Tax=Streptomyces sp. NPDC088725 TaxID=3365873 RepID=UPI003820144B